MISANKKISKVAEAVKELLNDPTASVCSGFPVSFISSTDLLLYHRCAIRGFDQSARIE